MDAGQRVGHHELGSEQSNAIDVEGRHLLGVLGECKVDVQARPQGRGGSLSGHGRGSTRHGRARTGDRASRAVAGQVPS